MMQNDEYSMKLKLTGLAIIMTLALTTITFPLPAYKFPVWLDGSLSDSGNAIPTALNAEFGAGAATLVLPHNSQDVQIAAFSSSIRRLLLHAPERFNAGWQNLLINSAIRNLFSNCRMSFSPYVVGEVNTADANHSRPIRNMMRIIH